MLGRASGVARREQIALALVALAAGASIVAPAQAVTPKRCRAAAALAKVGRTEDAQAAYLALVQATPPAACAEAGLRRLARREFFAAGGLIHSGFRDEAMKRIEAGRAASPAAPVPLEVRRFVGAQRTFEKVRALRDAGKRDEARDTLGDYIEKLDERGQETPAGGLPADMKALLDDNEGRLSRALRHLGGWLEDQGLLLLAVVLLGVVLVLAEVIPRLFRLVRPRDTFGTFSGGQKDDGLATAFAEELRVAVNEPGVALGGRRVDIAMPKTATPLPQSVTVALPQLGIVDALVALAPRVIPSRDRTVTGYLQPATAKGVGTSIRLAKTNGAAIREITLRQADYGPVPPSGTTAGASDYATLLPAATYWVRSALSKNPGRWRPQALFAAGVYQHQAGQIPHARRLYEAALAYTPPIPGVLINLGLLDVQMGSDLEKPDLEAIARGVRYVEQALEIL